MKRVGDDEGLRALSFNGLQSSAGVLQRVCSASNTFLSIPHAADVAAILFLPF